MCNKNEYDITKIIVYSLAYNLNQEPLEFFSNCEFDIT